MLQRVDSRIMRSLGRRAIIHCTTTNIFSGVYKGFLSVLGYIRVAEFESVVHFYPSRQVFKLPPF